MYFKLAFILLAYGSKKTKSLIPWSENDNLYVHHGKLLVLVL